MLHIIPEDDIFDHDESTTCDCMPSVTNHDILIAVHNRMDLEASHDAEVDPLSDEDPEYYYYSPGRVASRRSAPL